MVLQKNYPEMDTLLFGEIHDIARNCHDLESRSIQFSLLSRGVSDHVLAHPLSIEVRTLIDFYNHNIYIYIYIHHKTKTRLACEYHPDA